MSLYGLHPADGVDKRELLRLAGAVEHASEHPIAKAIATCAQDRVGALPAVSDFANVEGLGVTGHVDDHQVVVGRMSMLEDRGIAVPENLAVPHKSAEAAGRTAVVVAWGVSRATVYRVLADRNDEAD